MQELSKSQRARYAIRTFKILADALTLQGAYKPSGKMGERLADALKQLSPEIYGSMSDPRVSELKGLEYVIDRMPKGIERCSRLILTAQEDFQDTSFEKIIPLKRRRVSYAVSDNEICFVITTGKSEIYDILTHITFLNIEAQKIYQQVCNRVEGLSNEWADLEKLILENRALGSEELEQAIWNLSIILGRTYKETRATYDYLESSRKEDDTNNGLFEIIYGIGKRVIKEREEDENELTVYFTPSLREMIDHQKYATLWSENLKLRLRELGLLSRPIHIVSANMHSMRNLIYGAGALRESKKKVNGDIYEMITKLRESDDLIDAYAEQYGYEFFKDRSGSTIDANIIDMNKVDLSALHPDLEFDAELVNELKPVIVVIDYAFGTQAFDIMDELLTPKTVGDDVLACNFRSVSIMGKAGVLPGKKGDIMLATAHVMEGTANNYIVDNDLSRADFPDDVDVFVGPMVTVLGTSLQNRDVLERFHSSSWKAVGLEMEGGHYQRAISGAIIQGHIQPDMKTSYAYYASDNPMVSGQTLASGPMGVEGIVPTYMISKLILEKVLQNNE